MFHDGLLMVALSFLSLSLSGCGQRGDAPELGHVTGTVTLDGKPVYGTAIVFNPDNGRPARGRTDLDGKYELTYIRKTKGAKIGHNRVEIAPNEEDEEDAEEQANAGEDTSTPKRRRARDKVVIPARYNTKSELEADVKPGENVFDFKLESQPAEKSTARIQE
jgi:hypothetical protein